MSDTRQEIIRSLTSRWLPWILVAFTLIFALIHEIVQPAWTAGLPRGWQALLWAVALLALVLVYVVYNRIRQLSEERSLLAERLALAEQSIAESYEQMEAILRVNQKFVEANEDAEIIKPVLHLMVHLTGADGAAFVPLDEHGQPQSVISHGELPFPVMEAWVDYLVTPGVRDRCRECELKDIVLEMPRNCPLRSGPFVNTAGLLCLPVRRGEREFGVINLFLPVTRQLDERVHGYLRSLSDETALGLEGMQLRRREINALRQMQVLRQKTDLQGLLTGLLENVYHALEADFAVLVVPKTKDAISHLDLAVGNFPVQSRPFIDGILQGVMASGEPVLLGDVEGDAASQPTLKSLMAAPLITPERVVVGAAVVGNRRARGFHQRQLPLLRTVAGQVALIVQNADLMAELEYKTMIQERTRLAREIHDGLAQTIGFLKLQAAQLRSYLGRGEIERARQNADLFYATLSEAYQDARQAIDDLRISPHDCGLSNWLEQMANEFAELSGLEVTLEPVDVQVDLPPEIQAQLIRILQEALSNVRKHARANQVWIVCREVKRDLVMEVRDDGDGFSPEDVTMASRHGLRGMRERADLVGADFQVISLAGEGTTVRLRLPVKSLEEVGV